jgi:hypothetical protein
MLDHRLLAPEHDATRGVAGDPPLGEADLLDQAQALLDHDHLLVNGDDRDLALLPDQGGLLHPAIDGHPLRVDLLDPERLLDDLLVLADDGPHAHSAGDLLPLEDDSPLLDQGDCRVVVGELIRHLDLSLPRGLR